MRVGGRGPDRHVFLVVSVSGHSVWLRAQKCDERNPSLVACLLADPLVRATLVFLWFLLKRVVPFNVSRSAGGAFSGVLTRLLGSPLIRSGR